jgi:hypothetical protein
VPQSTAERRPPTEAPIYWFAKLEFALEDGDLQAAAEAQRELARLGVRVQYGRPDRKAVAGAPR